MKHQVRALPELRSLAPTRCHCETRSTYSIKGARGVSTDHAPLDARLRLIRWRAGIGYDSSVPFLDSVVHFEVKWKMGD